MTQPIDPVTVALTGKLPFYLVLAAVLTFPIAFAILRLYARAVRRSMRALAHGAAPMPAGAAAAPTGPAADPSPGSSAGTAAAQFHDLSEPPADPSADVLFARLRRGPRRAALVYVAAGVTYGVLMALAQLLAGGLEVLPVRFLFLVWVYSWPVVLTIGIVAATTTRGKVLVIAGYFLVLASIGVASMTRSPDLTWLQVFASWMLADLPATLLLLTFLSRRIRAVGPLIVTFMLLALIGSDVAVTVAGSRDHYLRAILEVTSSLRLGAIGTLVAMLLLGFVLFAVIGGIALIWIGRRYEAKKISDESVTVDAVWVLFAIIHSIDLVFGGPVWALAGLVAFGAYNAVARIGFSRLAHRDGAVQQRPTLLVLRSFSIGSDSERLFDLLGRYWRRAGSIEMIAGVDLVSQTVEPHEFLDFVSGKLSRRFIDGEESLNRRMAARDTTPDRDGRFRVNEFFCYDDTWKVVLSRLVRESDVVVMDLRGFSRQNSGCVFELHELARLVPLDRVVFVTDRRTDEPLLAEMLGDRRAGTFRLTSMAGGRIRQLIRAMAVAASATAPRDRAAGASAYVGAGPA